MIKTPVVVRHENGLDGRPIALLVQEASTQAGFIFRWAISRSMQRALWE